MKMYINTLTTLWYCISYDRATYDLPFFCM